ncbi:MAG: OadG family protein [Nitrospinia bacterium]|jgi:oxaloacetate decarboxylase gamma subunit|tara:strand:+ start:277 stop:552 length:276 start_codon:yes stop_codon:yes gene_type:complete
MEVSVLSAVNVSILAMGVIFIVLTILIFTIKVLVKLLPYEAPPPSPQRRQKPSSSENGNNHDDHVAAITATLAMHMGKTPSEFRIINISKR